MPLWSTLFLCHAAIPSSCPKSLILILKGSTVLQTYPVYIVPNMAEVAKLS